MLVDFLVDWGLVGVSKKLGRNDCRIDDYRIGPVSSVNSKLEIIFVTNMLGLL